MPGPPRVPHVNCNATGIHPGIPPRPLPVYSLPVNLSVVLITHNEESNLARTLESVQPLARDGAGEIIVVDSGSTDRTVEIAESFGAKVFAEAWKGYSAQKNSAIEKASGDWILSLDADEEVSADLARQIELVLRWRAGADPGSKEGNWIHDRVSLNADNCAGFVVRRRNFFLGRWMKHGGFWPDPKLRLWQRGAGRFENRAVHETVLLHGQSGELRGDLIHHSYPTLSDYIEHMNRYSSLGAKTLAAKGSTGFRVTNLVIRPWLTFFYNYFLRLGFLDGREGLLLHLYHAVYVSWKYAKAWELARARKS
jgi:glycosyltransferase involved in cell wall biosynthesis